MSVSDWEYTQIGILRSHLNEAETALANKIKVQAKIHLTIAKAQAAVDDIKRRIAEIEGKK